MFDLKLLAVWLIATHWIAHFATRKLQGLWRVLAYLGTFALVCLAPWADEIVAVRQMERLCREGAALKIDAQRIKGRRVKVSFEPLQADVPGIAVPVTYTKAVHRDAQTGEELGSRASYSIKRGWLNRSWFPEHPWPLPFGEIYCTFQEDLQQVERMAERFGFQIIY